MKKLSIWKFQLETTDVQNVNMPLGAEILCLQMQNGVPCIWAKVDLAAPTLDSRTFITYGTGHDVSDNPLKYIGTYQLISKRLVFHVFELLP